MENDLYINAVSPGIVTTEENNPIGNARVSSTKLAHIYKKVLEGKEKGKVFKPWNLKVHGKLYRGHF